jgi:hypothetical protein
MVSDACIFFCLGGKRWREPSLPPPIHPATTTSCSSSLPGYSFTSSGHGRRSPRPSPSARGPPAYPRLPRAHRPALLAGLLRMRTVGQSRGDAARSHSVPALPARSRRRRATAHRGEQPYVYALNSGPAGRPDGAGGAAAATVGGGGEPGLVPALPRHSLRYIFSQVSKRYLLYIKKI